MLSVFTITAVAVVLCGSVVSDSDMHPAVDGWNALLGPRQFFEGSVNTILVKSRDDAVILGQFKQLLSQDEVMTAAYLKFRTIFKKINDGTRERLNQLKKAMLLVVRHNLEAAAGKHTWTMAVNHFADLSLSELSVLAGSFSERDNSTRTQSVASYKRKPGSPAPPVSIDYVKEGIVSSVKYQGDCGTCVMFAAAAILESADARTNSRAPLDLSPQELAECAHRGFYCKGAGSDTRTNLRYLVEHGLASWDAYPYRGDKGTIRRCKRGSTARSATALEWEVADGHRQHTEESLMQTLAERGPLIVAIQSNHGFGGGWFYHKGVFSGSDCNDAIDTNHSVTLVGYGREKGLKYWLIKNSYGTTWGDEGYGKIKFSVCKILSRVSSIVAKPL